MSMKRVKYACAAAMLGLVIAAMPPFTLAYAETEVLESDVPELPIGTKDRGRDACKDSRR
jgi:hypothetical protein